MGYTTDFEGQFSLDKPLTVAHKAYLEKFAETRRMQRYTSLLQTMPDPVREAVGLPLGPEGAYFVGGTGTFGQGHDASIIDFNEHPEGQPGLWCQWIPNELGTALEWDGSEKFYNYIEWLEYLIKHFLQPWGYTLNGEVTYQGEDSTDRGIIRVKDNAVDTRSLLFITKSPEEVGDEEDEEDD